MLALVHAHDFIERILLVMSCLIYVDFRVEGRPLSWSGLVTRFLACAGVKVARQSGRVDIVSVQEFVPAVAGFVLLVGRLSDHLQVSTIRFFDFLSACGPVSAFARAILGRGHLLLAER